MPVLGVYPRDDEATASFRRGGQAGSTVMENTPREAKDQAVSRGPKPLSPGIVGGIVLVVVCVVAAGVLHQFWCKNQKCKACLVLKCGRRKLQKDPVRTKQLSILPASPEHPDKIPDTPEKSGFTVLDCSPENIQYSPDNEIGSTPVTRPRLQDIDGTKPRYDNTHSAISDTTLNTTPHTDPNTTATSSTLASTFLELVGKSDMGTMERPIEGEIHLPSNFSTVSLNTTRSRVSQALSVITLPSFIANDRPRPYSTSGGARMESPIRPHQRKRSSLFGQRLSGTDCAPPVSPVGDEDTSSNGSRPVSGALRIITSMLKRRGSASSSSLRSSTTSSRHSSRHFPRRANLSLGAEDEAVIEWKRLPPLPSAPGSSATQTPQSRRATGVGDFPAGLLPSYHEKESKPPGFFAPFVPLPPSPSVLVSPISSLAYAPPSPTDIPPTNGFTIPYTSYPPLPPSVPSTPGSFYYPPLPPSIPSTPRSFDYPPLPPSIPSTPGSFSYPPLPPSLPSTPDASKYPLPPSIPSSPRPFSYPHTLHSTDGPVDARSIHMGDSKAFLATAPPPRLFSGERRPYSSLDTPTTTVLSAFPGTNDGFLPHCPNNDEAGHPVHRGSSVSAFPQHSTVQKLALSQPLLTFPSSPSRPMSPRGPRPLLAPGNLSRSGTLHSQAGSIGQ